MEQKEVNLDRFCPLDKAGYQSECESIPLPKQKTDLKDGAT
jgi:hypothetical protein